MEEKVNNEQETKSEQDPRVIEAELLKETVKVASAEINLILVKHKLEFVVVHKLIVNPELKQEEIAHDIVLRPAKK